MANSETQYGAVLTTLAISLAAVMLVVSLAINVGWLITARSQGQALVDAAALTGAAGLPHFHANAGNESVVYDLTTSFNGDPADGSLNGNNLADNLNVNAVVGSDPNISPTLLAYSSSGAMTPPPPQQVQLGIYSEAATGLADVRPYSPLDATQIPKVNAVTVTKRYPVPLFFAGLSGFGSWNIDVSATAVLGSPSCFEPDIPIVLIDSNDGSGICDSSCNTDQTIEFGTQSPSTTDNAAFFDFWDSGNVNASGCRDFMNTGAGGRVLCVPEPIELNNGQVNSCLIAAKNRCNNANDWNCSLSTPHRATVPIIFSSDLPTGQQNANQTSPVRGFAQIDIIEVKTQGSPKYVKFRRVCNQVLPGSVGGGAPCGTIADQPVLVR